MKGKLHIPDQGHPEDHQPTMETNAELSPEAEAVESNLLPPVEQLDRFEKDMESHDGGNQPA